MRILYTLPILLSPCLTLAQKKPSDWRRVSLAPLDFAKKVDSGILNVKNAVSEAVYEVQRFDGGHGGSVLKNRIRDRKTFRVQFPKLTPEAMQTQTLIGKNGVLFLLTDGFHSLKPGVNPGFVPAKLSPVAAWPEYFQQSMFQCYVTGKGAFEPLVRDLLAGTGGFNVQMESRTMRSPTRTVPQVRLFAKRNPLSAKKLGQATIEIITDSKRYLPLLVRVSLTNAKGKNAYYEWTSEWRGPMKFDEKWFVIPKS